MSEHVKLSVVIGFKDWGLDRVAGAVRSIRDSLGEISSEIIVSDYGSADNTDFEETLTAAGAVYIYQETDGVWSRSRALNAGLKVATGEYMVTTDADMVFSPSTFPTILEYLEGDNRASYILQCRDLPEGVVHNDVFSGTFTWQEIERMSVLRPRWGMGGMIAFSREAYMALRGLDERMEIYGGEDIDLAKRLQRIGHRRIWIDDGRVRMYHIWHPSSREAADDTPEGVAAVQRNRDIHVNDKSRVRNLKTWEGRPECADPLVTVAISTFNRVEYLPECINSVLAQTFTDWELVIVNDGSTDGTEDFLESLNDSRIRVIHQENRGLAAARNLITREARGQYIAVHDDDDLMLPWRLEKQLESLAENSQGSYGGWIDFDHETGERKFNNGKKLTIESILFNSGTYLHPTLLVETEVLKAVPYNESMRSGSDYNLGVRMLRSGVKLQHAGHYLMHRRLHDGQITNSDNTLQKVSAVVTSFAARQNMTPAEVKTSRHERWKKDKVPIVAQAVAEPFTLPYLPDHLVERSVSLDQPVSLRSLDLESAWKDGLSVWIDENRKTCTVNKNFGHVSLSELQMMYGKYGSALQATAKLRDQGEPEIGIETAAPSQPILEPVEWFRDRIRESERGFYLVAEAKIPRQLDGSLILAGFSDGVSCYKFSSPAAYLNLVASGGLDASSGISSQTVIVNGGIQQ